MKLICIKDVTMHDDPDYRAFTEGKEYRGYKSKLKYEWDYKNVVRAVNDHEERHIIKHLDDDSLDSFFEEHFRELP